MKNGRFKTALPFLVLAMIAICIILFLSGVVLRNAWPFIASGLMATAATCLFRANPRTMRW